MAEELGSWPAEQATVLLEVLQKAGLTPEAKRTRDGILVTVPDGEADEAHRQLVANMDAIARAARPPTPPRGARKPRPVKGAGPEARGRGRGRPGAGGNGDKLGSERLLGAARPLVPILIGLLLLGIVLRFPLLSIVAIGALIYVLGKSAQQRGDGPDGGGGGFGGFGGRGR